MWFRNTETFRDHKRAHQSDTLSNSVTINKSMLDDEWASARMLESKWERESREFSGLANRWQIDRKHVCSCVSRCHFSSYFCQLKKQFANLSLTSVAATVVPFMEHLIPVVQKPRRKKPATEFASAAVASYSSSIGTWSNRWWRRTYIRETHSALHYYCRARAIEAKLLCFFPLAPHS